MILTITVYHIIKSQFQKHWEPHTPIRFSEQLAMNRGSNTIAFVNGLMRQAEAVNVRPGHTHLALGEI